jgi:ribosome-associated protein
MSAHAAIRKQVLAALHACEEKKAQEISVLELEKGSGAFTDYFLICSGANPRQIQTIADSVEEKLESTGLRATHREGYDQADWVLLDYVDFVVHVFSEKARKFYDLERLWRSARRLKAAELIGRRAQPASSRAQSRDGARHPARSSRSTIRKKKTS